MKGNDRFDQYLKFAYPMTQQLFLGIYLIYVKKGAYYNIIVIINVWKPNIIINREILKFSVVHTIEYYVAVKNNKLDVFFLIL